MKAIDEIKGLIDKGYSDEHGNQNTWYRLAELKALASIAESLAKIANSLENEDTRDSLAESASIWGTGRDR